MNKGRFVKGSTPWNKGKRGYMGANATSFKPGDLPPTALPVGSVTLSHKNGELETVYVNVDWHGDRKPHNIYAWYVWECYYKTDRPSGYVMYHLDGDKTNNDISNLRPVTRAELMRLNRK